MSNALTSLTAKLAKSLGIEDGSNLIDALKDTAFRSEREVTDAQMIALLVVANQYDLNPWTKEIYAFPDKKNGIVPVVGVDGWNRIINEHPMMDGIEFRQSESMIRMPGALVDAPEWIECVIYRKDRSRPIVIREFLDEVYRPPFEGNGNRGPYKVNGPWQTHTKRFLRHKAEIQCARIAFGFTGIFDQDEAERIVEAEFREVGEQKAVAMPKARGKAKDQPKEIEHQPDDGMQIGGNVIEGDAREKVSAERNEAGGESQKREVVGGDPASPGMLAFIRNKAQEKQIAWEKVASEFGIDTLDGIDTATANSIIAWVKAQ